MKRYIEINKKAYNKLAKEYAKNFEYYSKNKEERKTILPFIKNIKKHFKNPNILELGPGSGLDLTEFEKRKFKTSAIELAKNIIKECKKVAPKQNIS